ncbi:hypothetical protein BV25DRAFT_1820308 [Artomyces pyxidatus]|uniref:Uncharacterized protein n=1 Tax=Artomyces pyxidatus TaxID=48021 RepID=A0ACB8TDA2_9AGAM|nr:hypothetical protein BV25DRAFT_1820308 [Artomyces pyxidatus]
MPYVLHTRSSSTDSSPVTFSKERGPGAFAPLNALPRRAAKKSLFHIPADDDHEPSPPPSPPLQTPEDLPLIATAPVPFPSSSPLSSPKTRTVAPPPPLQRTHSNIILSNGRPLKPSLKSASSSSLADDMAGSDFPRHAHARAQSMPSTPHFGPKNVHFKEKDEGLESVRLFRRTGKPQAVSKNTADDTETETETEHSGYPFPVMHGSPLPPLTEIASADPVPSEHPSPYANIHVESISLPPSRPPVLRGTVLVRNLSFEKHVGVRFTLDEWTTVSEVLGTYAGPVGPREALAGQLSPVSPSSHQLTVGDLVGTAHAWDRFSFAIRLEDYESRLAARTLFLVARFTAPGTGEWWDNNEGKNYRVSFRAKPVAAPVQTIRPSPSPFLANAVQDPRTAFAARRTTSTPGIISRLNLRHYAAPAPPSPKTPPPPVKKEEEEGEDEGFGTGSEDESAGAKGRPQLTVEISPPTPTSPAPKQEVQAEVKVEEEKQNGFLRRASPPSPSSLFSPTSVMEPAPGSDSTYAALIREWCFAQGAAKTSETHSIGVGMWGGGPMGSVG